MKKLITAVVLITLLSILLPTTPVQAATRSVDIQITANKDDCEVGANKYWTLTNVGSSTGYLNPSYYSLETGLRFQSVAIPQGVTITTAHLVFTCQATTSGKTVRAIISGEDTNDAAEFSTLDNYRTRAKNRTTAKVYWDNINPWTKNEKYPSPEIKTIIQEIVNRKNWRSGNDIVIFWGDPGNDSSQLEGCYRAQYTHEGSPTQSARLHIEYEYTETLSEQLGSQISSLSTQVTNLSNQVDKLNNSTIGLQSIMSELSNDLASLREELTAMRTTLEGKLDTMDNRLSTLENTILTIGEKIPQRLLVIEESLAELKARSTTTILDWVSFTILILLGIAIFSRIRSKRGME